MDPFDLLIIVLIETLHLVTLLSEAYSLSTDFTESKKIFVANLTFFVARLKNWTSLY